MRRERREVQRSEGYNIHIIGVPPPDLRDIYHALLRAPWWAMLALIVVGWLALNVVFAGLYLASGGIAHAEPGSFADAFFFSVQTMGTIGYGAMYPESTLAEVIVVVETVTGLVSIAIATGLVFVRFSQVRARVMFSERIAITPMDGVPTLMIRIANRRRGSIVDAHFRLSFTRTTTTREGAVIYRMTDLPLVRDRAPALARSWMLLHRIEPGTPLAEDTPESLAASEVELDLTVLGLDEVSLQPAYARARWSASRVVWGARLADVISDTPGGDMRIDLGRFHDLEPTEPTEAFPYPRPSPR